MRNFDDIGGNTQLYLSMFVTSRTYIMTCVTCLYSELVMFNTARSEKKVKVTCLSNMFFKLWFFISNKS